MAKIQETELISTKPVEHKIEIGESSQSDAVSPIPVTSKNAAEDPPAPAPTPAPAPAPAPAPPPSNGDDHLNAADAPPPNNGANPVQQPHNADAPPPNNGANPDQQANNGEARPAPPGKVYTDVLVERVLTILIPLAASAFVVGATIKRHRKGRDPVEFLWAIGLFMYAVLMSIALISSFHGYTTRDPLKMWFVRIFDLSIFLAIINVIALLALKVLLNGDYMHILVPILVAELALLICVGARKLFRSLPDLVGRTLVHCGQFVAQGATFVAG